MAELRIPQTDTPTIFNKSAIIGAWLAGGVGGLISLIPGAGTVAGTSIYLASLAAGGLIGGNMGKARMEDEAINGKKVSPPTLFNKDIFAYGMGTAVAIGVVVNLAVTTANTVMNTSILSNLSVPAAAGVLATTIGVPILSAAYGAFAGKERMQKEYDQALGSLQEKTQSQSLAIQKAQEQLASVAHDLAPGKSFAETELERRANQLEHAR